MKSMKTKKTYTSPVLIVHGSVEKLTLGSRLAISDAWFGVDGNDGLIGPKCSPGSDAWACTADGS
jgi:hypothetical protein